jgi:peptide/nickel transport system ATP-binding protein
MTVPLLDVKHVSKIFSSGFFNNRKMTAVDDVSLALPADTARLVALAGESGSGKTTLAQMILGFLPPTLGQITFDGQDVYARNRHDHGRTQVNYFQKVQAIFQNPFEAFNPFYRINHIFDLTIARFKLAKDRTSAVQQVIEALQAVHLNPDETLGRYPHQLSGGQLQRLMIARALLLKPKLMVADEPVSMIDVSLRALILDLLMGLKTMYGISIVYITHDLSTALQIADEILIMYQGSLVETGDATTVIQRPAHPYTQLLVRSIPLPDPTQKWSEPLDVEVESDKPAARGTAFSGCKFFNRCPSHMEVCQTERPPLIPIEGARQAACFLYKEFIAEK